ncbi:MAG: phytoene desaturase family protein [Bacillota bacterium]
MAKIGIIGAGPGGLAAGILLANQGLDVEIFEARDRVGGRNGSITEKGYTFDIGPTFYMMPFILESIFAKTGRDINSYLEFTELNPYYRLIFADGSMLEPSADRDKFEKSIADFNKEDVDGFARYMNTNEKKMKYTLPVLQKPWNTLLDLADKDLMKLLTVLNPHRSLWQELGQYFSDERVKVGFTFQSKYLGMSPFNCPSMFSILPYTEYKWGIYHITGGLNKLSLAMAEVFEELGGTIKLNSEVKKVDIDNKKVRGIFLENDEFLEFDEVIMNADFAWGMKNLFTNEERKKYTNQKLDTKNYSCSTFMLYLGLSKKYQHLAHNNVYIAKDYQKNFLEIESKKVLSKDPSFYVQYPSVTDDSLAPEGHSTLYLLVPTSNLISEIDWQEEKEDFRELMISKLEERAGLRDIREHIVYEKMITPLDWQKEMKVGYGATFNLGHNLGQMLIFRPHNKFEEFRNMWLVGGGTNPGSGLPTIYESGRITANLLLKKYGLEYEFDHKQELNRVFNNYTSGVGIK